MEFGNTALIRAIVEVTFEYMRACKLPKSGVYIYSYITREIFSLNKVSLVQLAIADALTKLVNRLPV